MESTPSLLVPPWPAWRSLPGLARSPGGPDPDRRWPTEVRVAWRPQALLVRFACASDEIHSPFTGRDRQHWKGDVVEVFLARPENPDAWIEVQVSPANQIFDQIIRVSPGCPADADGCLAEEDLRRDPGWDYPGLATATGRSADGWWAELELPAAGLAAALGGPAELATGQRLRAHLMRYEQRLRPDGGRDLHAHGWARIPHGQPHRTPARMGHLILGAAT